ncbi:MAG: hypothetical protein ACR2HJ_03975 [Fimbriimonadales bacterium]
MSTPGSADGLRDVFPAVEQLVASAPPLRSWKVIAFRQPDSSARIRMGDVELRGDAILYRLLNDELPVEIDFFVPGIVDDNDQPTPEEGEYIKAAFIMIDSTIGEYAAAMKLGVMRFRPLVIGAGLSDAKKLVALPADLAKLAPR